LVEVLALAGGLDTNAGSTLKVTRRKEWGPIPLPNAADDPTGQFRVADLDIKSLLEATNPEANILVQPNDVISVPRADTVYVTGHVQKPGGFLLNERRGVTVLEAVSMAGGFDRTAKPQNARLLRHQPGSTSRVYIAVNLKKILEGKQPDVRMQPEDILFVPNNVPKSAALRALDAAIQMGTGVVVWR
jgi:polysaccharide export outer membrane protein